MAEYPTSLGGGINCILDPHLDRSKGPPRCSADAAIAFKNIMSADDLLDIWRHRFPSTRSYTHYSSVYDTHTRIDYWLLSGRLESRVLDCNHLPRTYSHHSPVQLTLSCHAPRIPPFTWRFPPYLLLDTVFREELAIAIEEFFFNNIGSVPSFAVVWESFKVYIRGVVISKHAGVLRSIQRRLTLLEKDIHHLECSLSESRTTHNAAQLKLKLLEFQETANDELSHMGKYATARVYGERDRPGAILAGLLRPKRELDNMVGMLDDSRTPLNTTDDIVTHFQEHYQNLYTSQFLVDSTALEDYLSYIKMPWLVTEHREYLMAPLTADEIRGALSGMASGKAPGADRLPVYFYKEFLDILLPHLQTLYEDMAESGIMSPSMREAIIVMLFKPGKSPSNCSSY